MGRSVPVHNAHRLVSLLTPIPSHKKKTSPDLLFLLLQSCSYVGGSAQVTVQLERAEPDLVWPKPCYNKVVVKST